jgi:hypothetical protein
VTDNSEARLVFIRGGGGSETHAVESINQALLATREWTVESVIAQCVSSGSGVSEGGFMIVLRRVLP